MMFFVSGDTIYIKHRSRPGGTIVMCFHYPAETFMVIITLNIAVVKLLVWAFPSFILPVHSLQLPFQRRK